MRAGREKPHILLIYRRMIPSIILCGDAQLTWLAQQGTVEYQSCQEQALNQEILDWADAVVLGRLDSWYEKKLAAALRANGKYLAYILDDDLLNVPEGLSSSPHYLLEETRKNIREIMALSHCVLSPSPRLLEKYAVDGRKGILAEEPALYQGPFKPHKPGEPIVIGFAGSLDRTGDVERILKDTLFRLRAEYGEKIAFAFFGAVPGFAKALDARTYPYSEDYAQYLDALGGLSWDIGLAPMPEADFHSFKHYIKFIEYSSMGAVSALSDAAPYTRLKEKGIRAVFCKNTADSWYSALKTLIDDPGRLERLRLEAYECSKRFFSPEKAAETVIPLTEMARNSAAARGNAPSVPYRLTLNKALNFIHLSASFVKKHKWNAPKMLVKKLTGR